MKSQARAAVCCCHVAPAASTSGVWEWRQTRAFLPLPFLCLLFFSFSILLAPTATVGSCLPPSLHPRSSLGASSTSLPYACISNPFTSLRSIWRGLWDRATPAAAAATALPAAAAAPATKALAATQVYAGLNQRGIPSKTLEGTTTVTAATAVPATTVAASIAAAPAKTATAAPVTEAAKATAAANTPAGALSEAAASTAAAAAADEVLEAALWFEHQRDLWRRKTSIKIQKRLEAELAAQEAERKQQKQKELQNRPRRLLFSSPSLKQRGWLATRSSSHARPLSCLLYAAVPPGRLAVAPASSRTNTSSKTEDIPWVSFSGLARLNRADPSRIRGLWFGIQAPEYASFYEFAPLHVLLLRFLLDHKPAVPCLLAAACCGSAFACRVSLSRFLLSFLLSSTVWSRYALWSPLLHAPPALALLLLRLLLQSAAAAGGAATAACRRGLEELESSLLEASIPDNVHLGEGGAGMETAIQTASAT